MGQTVQCGIGHGRIREQGDPVLRGPVAGNNDRCLQMPLGYDLIEVFGLDSCEGSEAKVIDDKEIWPEELFDSLLPRLVCPGSVKASKHFNGLVKEHIAAFPACLMTYGLGQMGFTDTGRTIDKDMLFFLNEQAGGMILDQSTFDLRVKGEIKVLKGLLLFERGAGKPFERGTMRV